MNWNKGWSKTAVGFISVGSTLTSRSFTNWRLGSVLGTPNFSSCKAKRRACFLLRVLYTLVRLERSRDSKLRRKCVQYPTLCSAVEDSNIEHPLLMHLPELRKTYSPDGWDKM